jgi:hypothetical protein
MVSEFHFRWILWWFFFVVSGKIQSSMALSPILGRSLVDNHISALPTCIYYDETQKRDICNRRGILDQAKSLFGAFLLGGAVVGYVSVSHAEENDPFAAMDAAISTGILSSNVSTISNNPSSDKATYVDPGVSKTSPAPSESRADISDLEKALRQSQRRKTIDPRTHG